MSLKEAPTHVQVAVDLIMLLEDNNVDPNDVLKAIKIVEQDYLNKLGNNINKTES
ncbi:DUF2496 domain-containing protein [Catenovulum adriaticum]|uniref:DUF2496 domain-containing protein n=1 Tax=Catenovulum adriaticum TaxID=2984846 RepID=A0ABY7AJS3_9ALTE|nr:DUF2496 domain-containing protein [Catenovulum sp. TS8]WAJ69729.1 DUF2496 domain-containing protein [Catenovulum sp. TS8]